MKRFAKLSQAKEAYEIDEAWLPEPWCNWGTLADNGQVTPYEFQPVFGPGNREEVQIDPDKAGLFERIHKLEELLARAPAKPEPAKPEPAKPEPAKPEPAKPEPAKPEPAKPEPAKPEPAKWEPNGGNWYSDERGGVGNEASSNASRLFGAERKTKEQAEKACDKMRVFNRLLTYHDEFCPGFEFKYGYENHYVYFDEESKTYQIESMRSTNIVGCVFFAFYVAKELCKKLNSGEVVL